MSPPARSAAEQLACALAGTEARRRAERERLLALLSVVDYDELAERLDRQLVLASLGSRLLALGAPAPPAFASAVQAAVEAGGRTAFLHESLLRRVQQPLRRSGIRAVPLKGFALGVVAHADPALRPASDLDLLVDAGDLDRVLGVLSGLGFHRLGEPLDARGRPLLHHRLVSGSLPPIEVHWRVHWYEERFGSDLVARAREHPLLGWRPAPADELASLLLFYARDGFAGLKLAADAGGWWDRAGATLPASGLAEHVAAYPDLRSPLRAAAGALEHLIGLPRGLVPTPAGVRTRMAVGLANPRLTGTATQIRAEIALTDALLTPPRQLGRFVRRELLPSVELLLSRQPELRERGPARVRVAQLLTPPRVLRRWLLTLRRVAAFARTRAGAAGGAG